MTRLFAALRHYASVHRYLLEASIAAFKATGDRNSDIPLTALWAHDDAYAAIPGWLRWAAWPVERHVARQADYRHRTGQE